MIIKYATHAEPPPRTETRRLQRAVYLLRCQLMAMQEQAIDSALWLQAYEADMYDIRTENNELHTENNELRTENNELRERLARYGRIAATCEELGCEGK